MRTCTTAITRSDEGRRPCRSSQRTCIATNNNTNEIQVVGNIKIKNVDISNLDAIRDDLEAFIGRWKHYS
jgi:hypothetical protein